MRPATPAVTAALAARDRWLDLMGYSMREVEIPAAEAPLIGAFFAQASSNERGRHTLAYSRARKEGHDVIDAADLPAGSQDP